MYLSNLLARRGRHGYENHHGVTIQCVFFPSFLSHAFSRFPLSTRYSHPWNNCPLHPHHVPIPTSRLLFPVFLPHLSDDITISQPPF